MSADLFVIDDLEFTAGTVRIYQDDITMLPALKQHYVQQARRFGDEGVDAIYFSGEHPSIYFKQVPAFTPEVVEGIVRIQRKIWNQGKVPFIYIESPTEIRVYNCYNTPRYDKQENPEEGLLLFKTRNRTERIRNDLEVLRDVFGKVSIESGSFWQQIEFARQVDIKKRVDRTLVENIKKARRQLRIQGLTDSIIHDLLLRSLFILYLEDRKATDQAFYEAYLPGATSYFGILNNIQASYRLFDKLGSAFNGNLCPVQSTEYEVVTSDHLETIKRCFWSDLALSGQQALLGFDWRIFDFGFIPIQVISEIYEDFLSEEVGEEQMARTGAFYTPHALAEFILNQVLPYPSINDVEYHIPTIDPTCGSGIFLVDTLNRLLDRWEYANPNRKLTFDIIKEIVLNNIFGVEIEPEAIKVAAFSIYLTMLDRLDPKVLWQNNRFPYLIYDEDKPDQQIGRNLFRMSSLGNGLFAERTYALVVGNPPFSKNVSPEVMRYLRARGYGKETVIAFLDRAMELCPTGRIALISTSKVLFNRGLGFQRFRRSLFNDAYVDTIYNFSALRRVSQRLGGRNLFASATRPVCVLFYSRQFPENLSDRIVYYTPTTTIKNRLVDGIAIDQSDVKYLPRTECQDSETHIWKAAMWGTERDYKLVQRLMNQTKIGDYLAENNFLVGVGYQLGATIRYDDTIRSYPHMYGEAISRYYTTVDNTSRVSNGGFRRLGALETYKAPHTLIKVGQSDKRFCATYLDYDCSFRHNIIGVSSSDRPDDLKILTAYLNSSFAFYLLFLTATDWGVERETVNPNEIFNLPALCFSLPEDSKSLLVRKIDEIMALKKENHFFSIDHQIIEIEKEIEIALWDGFNLSSTDRILIEDLLKYRLGAFQDRYQSVAFFSLNTEVTHAYAIQLCQTINQFLQSEDGTHAHVGYFAVNRTTPLQVIVLRLNEQKSIDLVEELPPNYVDAILHDLEKHTYREAAESIYYRRLIRYYKDDTIYIVKPNERRFWSRSMAMNDADEIILEILSSEA